MVEAADATPASDAELPVDGERFLPEKMYGDVAIEHLHRYRFASQFVADREVLDIASGEGYGSALLAEFARSVIGVDVAQQAVDHARHKYGATNLEFRVGSCAQIPLDDNSIDVIVSFETIEHHDQHESMMLEFKRVLRPGGLLVISSPDREIYSERPNTHNPFHVKELYRDEFETLLAAHFKRFQIRGQRLLFGSSIFAESDRGKVAFETLQSDQVSFGQPADPVYLVALASDGKLPVVSGSLLEGELAPTLLMASTVKLLAHRDSAALGTALSDPWYRERNSDVVAAGLDPVEHWWTQGANEGRLPAADMPSLVSAVLAERKAAIKDQTEQLRQERDRHRPPGLELVAERNRMPAEVSAAINAQAEHEHNSAQAFSRLQRQIEADWLDVAAKLESAMGPLRQAQAREAEIIQGLLKSASDELLAFRAEVQNWRSASVTPWIEEQRSTTALLAKNLAEESQANREWQTQSAEDRKVAERNALAQFRANQVLNDQLSSIQAQVEADREQTSQRDKAVDERLEVLARIVQDKFSATEASLAAPIREMSLTISARLDREAEANQQWRQQFANDQMLLHDRRRADQVLADQQHGEKIANLREQVKSESLLSSEREQRVARRLDDRFAALSESQRVLTAQQSSLNAALQADRQKAREAAAWRSRHLKLVTALSGALAEMKAGGSWRATGSVRALVERLAEYRARAATEIGSPISVKKADSLAELLAHDDAAFIACAYVTLLNRVADGGGYLHYLSRLNAEGDRIEILRALVESDEGKRQVVKLPGLGAALLRHRIKSWLGQNRTALYRHQQRQLNKLLLELNGEHEYTDIPPALEAGLASLAESTAVVPTSVGPGEDLIKAVDPTWYLHVYGDVAAAGMDPQEHYRVHGRADGRFPNAGVLLTTLFDFERYFATDPEAYRVGIDPLQHYISNGLNENRTRGVSLRVLQFDRALYLKCNPDVQIAGVDPLQHFATRGVLQGRTSSTFRGLDKIEPEPLSYVEPLCGLKAKLIAFYLPQYHPIPENDEWWGKGFTEWSNVSRGRPFYKDHDQPRLPGELGFYDLRVVENMRRQAELARIHGIHAFCFFVYWFGGKRLLERPVDEFLRHPDIDMNFCLCWANENWTRRWDGLEDDVLIGQSHSPEDDLAFIADISRAFADPRYVRVDGKPVLVVYRPELLPDSRATSERWRQWCREKGIGEIHLCFTKSFSRSAPSEFGMDASIEYPPQSVDTQEITRNVEDLDPTFRGQIHNYLFTSKIAVAAYVRPSHLEYRGVMPSWDNTARKLERAISYYGATPELYAEWLRSAVDETCRNLGPEDRLVFINAWNEWCEGAYLEPDRRRGYAYLSRTREVMAAFSSSAAADSELLAKNKATPRVAVVVHLHYSDLLEYIAGHLQNMPEPYDLYFSVREGTFKQVRQAIRARFPTATVVSYPNHGRDVVPFLHILSHIRDFGYEAICKIHSKKSRHREDGDRWRDEVFDRLLGSAARVEACLALIRAGNGVVAPAGHLLPGATSWGSNARRVTELAVQMQCPPEWLEDFAFPAGTMFWFQPKALEPLLSLGLRPTDFEDETGQVDGTTAHAVERLIGLSARKAGLSVVTTPDGPTNEPGAYPFAVSTSADGKPIEAPDVDAGPP